MGGQESKELVEGTNETTNVNISSPALLTLSGIMVCTGLTIGAKCLYDKFKRKRRNRRFMQEVNMHQLQALPFRQLPMLPPPIFNQTMYPIHPNFPPVFTSHQGPPAYPRGTFEENFPRHPTPGKIQEFHENSKMSMTNPDQMSQIRMMSLPAPPLSTSVSNDLKSMDLPDEKHQMKI